MRLRDRQSRFWRCGFSGLSGRVLLTALFGLLTAAFLWQPLPAAAASDTEASAPVSGICQDTSKKLVRSLFIPEEPQQGLCPYASLPQDIFLT